MGPFLLAKAEKKFVILACEYFIKWVEAEAVASITQKSVEIFFRKTSFIGSKYCTES